MSEQRCIICERATRAVFNLAFKAVPICESCASTIAAQQVQWWASQKYGSDQ